MTALVVIENCDLDETVEVTADAAGTEGSSMYLSCGEKLSVRDLLYGLMLLSGNDAAVALAVHVGGTVESFVRIMNDRAAKLGLTNTHFVTPNGLHDAEHYTTAYELALIGAEALKNETFRQIVSTQYYTAETGDRVRTMKIKMRCSGIMAMLSASRPVIHLRRDAVCCSLRNATVCCLLGPY